MLLAEFAERAGQAGVDVSFKIDGPRERRKWTVILGSPPYVGEYWVARADVEDIDALLDFARKRLVQRPGEWGWLAEPVEDAAGFADVMEEIGAMGVCFIVQHSQEHRWTYIGAGKKAQDHPSLEACLFEGYDRLSASAPTPPPPGTAR